MKLTTNIVLAALFTSSAGASVSYAVDSDPDQSWRAALLVGYAIVSPGDKIWPQPKTPHLQNIISANSPAAAEALLFVNRHKRFSLSLHPCCSAKDIVGGGFTTHTSNISAAGLIWQRLDMLFALREPTGIPGLDSRDQFANARVVATFLRGDQLYAECELNLDLNSRSMHFDLAIESINERVYATSGSCDTNPQARGIQAGVPQLSEQDRIVIFAFREDFGIVQLGESTAFNY